MTAKLLIADDEAFGIKRMRSALASIEAVEVIGEARSGLELLELAEQHLPDIILADVEMPEMNGIDAVEKLPDPKPEIIFSTGHDPFKFQSSNATIADWLMKPITADRLQEALKRAMRRRELSLDDRALLAQHGHLQFDPRDSVAGEIEVPLVEGSAVIPLAMIDWIEGAGQRSIIHTPYRSYFATANLETLESRMPGLDPIRIHRTAMVSASRVANISSNGRSHSILMKDGAIVPADWRVTDLRSLIGLG